MIISRKERKLDRLNMNSKGATNQAPTRAVPMHIKETGVERTEEVCKYILFVFFLVIPPRMLSPCIK